MRSFSTSLRAEGIALLGLLAGWCGLTLVYPPYILPTPWEVWLKAPAYLPADFWRQAGVTLFRTVTAFALALGSGTLVGLWAYARKWVAPMSALMVALQVLPGTVLGVIFLLLFGLGDLAPILLAVCLTLPTLAINTVTGLSQRDRKRQQYLLSLGSNRLSMFRYSYLPALVPAVRSNVSLGMSLTVKAILMGEFIGAQEGLGFLLNNARLVFNLKEVFFLLCLLLLFTLVFQAAQTLATGWLFRKYEYAE
jgi:NitT/TauT family transport system permease protein